MFTYDMRVSKTGMHNLTKNLTDQDIYEKIQTSLVGQWLRLHVANAGEVGSIPGQGPKIPHATAQPRD